MPPRPGKNLNYLNNLNRGKNPDHLAFTHDIEMERKYFGNRDEWKPYLEESTIRVKLDLKPETNNNRGNCRAKGLVGRNLELFILF